MPSAPTEQRKLTAIMFTDMVGYSALAQRNEALALELLEEHRRLLRPIFPQFNGREVETAGDAFLVEFASALEATQCAVEIQRTLLERNQVQPGERHVRLRIGIHVGDVVHRDGKVMGDAVNIAARIEPLAAAGGVCVSEDVARQIRNKLPHPTPALGPAELKNIELPVVVHRVVLPWEGRSSRREEAQIEHGRRSVEREKRSQSLLTSAATKWGGIAALLLLAVGLGWWLVHQASQVAKQSAGSRDANNSIVVPSPAVADQKSIAVLPFVNMSADKDNEYFSDGIAEEILNALARTPGLRVAARASAFSFKGKNESVQSIGKALNVGVLLEGSVRRAANQLRITAKLVNVADGFHLWSDTFDRKAEDVFAIQSEVAQRVQEALKGKLLAGTSGNGSLAGTDNLEAYDLYLRARHFWNLRTGVDAQRAVGLFQQATEKDPKFAAAYAGLASSYVLLPEYASVPVREVNSKARAAARRALELDVRSAEAHAGLGICAQFDWDLVEAEREYQEAIRLNPNHATTRHWYSILLSDAGKWDDAIAEGRKAQALDPLSPVIQGSLGERLFWAGRRDEAMVETDKALKLSSDFPGAHLTRGKIFLVEKKLLEAVAEFEQVRKKTGDTPYALGRLGDAYSRAGRTNEARQILEKLKSISAGGGNASYEIAFVHWSLGETNQAFVWLERAVESRDWDPRAWKFDPLMAEVVKDPRYTALLKKYGLDK